MGNTGNSQLDQTQDNLALYSVSKSDIFHANRNNLLTMQNSFCLLRDTGLNPEKIHAMPSTKYM